MARIDIIALGGTIASTSRADMPGVVPVLGANDLLAAVPAVKLIADIESRTFATKPSVEITLSMLSELASLIRTAADNGVDGVVITQGTDTIDETAFVLDVMLDGAMPVVVTGAMRNPTLPSADGPANVFAAVACAADPACRDLGVLVAFDDEIHAAAAVQKRHTASTGAFWSPTPVGQVIEGRPVILAKPVRRPTLAVAPDAELPFIPILKPGLDDDPRLVEAVLGAGAVGIVAELFGGGHASMAWSDALADAATRVPVVFASRTRGGRVLSRTYGQKGGEMDLMRRGLIGACDLDALKARLLLGLLVLAGTPERFPEFADLSWRSTI